ncbi:MAG: hypothetical protein AB7N76_12400 [Planctomycetota bacterium]
MSGWGRACAAAVVVALFPLWPAAAQTAAEVARERARQATILLTTREPRSLAAAFYVTRDIVVTHSSWPGREEAFHARVVEGRGALAGPRVELLFVNEQLAFYRAAPLEAALTPIPLTSVPLAEGLPVEVQGYSRGADYAAVPTAHTRAATVASWEGPRERPDAVVLGPYRASDFVYGGAVLDAHGRLLGVAANGGNPRESFAPCWQVEEALGGSLQGFLLQGLRRDLRTFSGVLRAILFDPNDRLGEVELRYWSEAPAEQADGVWGIGERWLRSEVRRIPLTWDPEARAWVGPFELQLNLDWDVFVELRARGKDGSPRPARVRKVQELARLVGERSWPQHFYSNPRLGLAPRSRPTGEAPVVARERADGREHARIDARVEQVRFGGEVLALAAPPSGRRFYALVQGRSEVLVCDALTLQEVDRIATPRRPISLWCDEENLVVACDESRVVRVIDRKSHAPRQTLRAEGKPRLVLGAAAGGGWLSVWEARGGERVVWLQPAGESQVYPGPHDLRMRWATFSGGHGIYQDQMSRVQCVALKTSTRSQGGPDHPIHRFGRNGQLFAAGRSWASGDRVVLPLMRQDLGAAWTVVTSGDLSARVVDFPGLAVGELPEQDAFVCVTGCDRAGKLIPEEVQYVARGTGMLLRRIVPDRKISLVAGPGHVMTCFVPGVERLLLGGSGSYTLGALTCGPAPRGAAGPPAPRARNAPPSAAKVGEVLSYQPRFDPPLAAGTVFALARGPAGARVDPATGTLTWTPGPLELGTWDLELSAELEGRKVTALAWVVEVR